MAPIGAFFVVPARPPLTAINAFLCLNGTLRSLRTVETVEKHLAPKPVNAHREIKGRFRKRVGLANVPSFLFSFRGNMRTYPRSGLRSGGASERTLVPVFVPGEHPPKPLTAVIVL